MKNTIIFGTLIALTAITICFSYLHRSKFEDKLWAQNSNLLEMRFALNDIATKEKITFSTNGIVLSDSVVSLLPSDTYILRLHNGICMSCYAENLVKLKEMLDKTKKTLFILGSYTFDMVFRDEFSFIQNQNVSSINIPALKIMPADSLEIPYVFHLNTQGKIDHLHFFEKRDFSLTQQYLESIQRLLPQFR